MSLTTIHNSSLLSKIRATEMFKWKWQGLAWLPKSLSSPLHLFQVYELYLHLFISVCLRGFWKDPLRLHNQSKVLSLNKHDPPVSLPLSICLFHTVRRLGTCPHQKAWVKKALTGTFLGHGKTQVRGFYGLYTNSAAAQGLRRGTFWWWPPNSHIPPVNFVTVLQLSVASGKLTTTQPQPELTEEGDSEQTPTTENRTRDTALQKSNVFKISRSTYHALGAIIVVRTGLKME